MKDIYDDHVDNWIKKVSASVDNYKICPFASKARYTIEKGNKSELYSAIKQNIDNIDLIVFIYEEYIDVDSAKELEVYANSHSEHIVLLDHPEDPGFIDNMYTGNGKYVIFLIQNRASLLAARYTLFKTNYYDKWSEEYYKKIVINSEK